jgi:hypothetical protein
MADPEQQPVIDEYHRQLEMLIKTAGSTPDRILSFAKLRIEANDRLILLASGILTLTVSGAVSLASRDTFHPDWITLRPLFGAWKLLILAIICCIIANYREQWAASMYDSDLLAAELWTRRIILAIVGKKLHPQAPREMPANNYVAGTGAKQEKIAWFLGWAARVSTVVALILLYQFAKSLLLRH